MQCCNSMPCSTQGHHGLDCCFPGAEMDSVTLSSGRAVRLRNGYCSSRLFLIAPTTANPQAPKASEDGSGTVVPPPVDSPKRINVGPPSPPVPAGMKLLTHAPVLPLNSNTSPDPKLVTKRLPFGPKVKSRGRLRPLHAPVASANDAMKAPSMPLYSKTWLVPKLVTYRLPSGPNATPRALVRPPLPAATNSFMKAPVVPLN